MKTILILLVVLASPALAFAESDYTLAPDGTYVSDGHATLAPYSGLAKLDQGLRCRIGPQKGGPDGYSEAF